jgi:hypothetical protein
MVATTAVTRGDKVEKAIFPTTEQLRIGYMPAKRALVFKPFSRGKLVMTDIRGKVVYRSKPLNGLSDGTVTVLLRAPLGMGIYYVRFEGVKGIQQGKISIVK